MIDGALHGDASSCMLKIYGRPNSINVQKVVFCLDEIGLTYDLVLAGRQHGHVDTPEFRKMNPNGLVPVLVDDGFVLWESNAIVRYLCAQHSAGALWPDDLRVRADADRWMDWQTTTFGPAIGPAFYNLIRQPDDARDHAAVSTSQKKGEACAAILNEWLSDRPFVSGETFTMGDIAIGAIVLRWLNLPLERAPAPNLEAYCARIMERPAGRKALVLPLS
ncbi:Glutathione S-transferase [Afifella marina DSM 2698]|uniref:Glutathione S-transferase n=2 Tax=Afifella marina TaxID=1080 RepID=A0A1G5NHX0_AFIMA|nr:Glutathione S-transferase [Afifella marina DSM 2698]